MINDFVLGQIVIYKITKMSDGSPEGNNLLTLNWQHSFELLPCTGSARCQSSSKSPCPTFLQVLFVYKWIDVQVDAGVMLN